MTHTIISLTYNIDFHLRKINVYVPNGRSIFNTHIAQFLRARKRWSASAFDVAHLKIYRRFCYGHFTPS